MLTNNPDNKIFNFEQANVIDKINLYIQNQKTKNQDPSIQQEDNMPFKSTQGICLGLAAYWLYLKRIGEEGSFKHKLDYILNWDAEKFTIDSNNKDTIFEDFINASLFAHNHDEITKLNAQKDMHASFAYMYNDGSPTINKAEFDLTFIFTRQTLAKLIQDCMHPNKMVLFGNGYHALGAMLEDGVYYIYDPSSTSGPIACKDQAELADKIFVGLAKFCGSTDYIALNMTAFDLVEELYTNNPIAAGAYPEPTEYCAKMLDNKKYKTSVFKNSNILRVCMRYSSFEILDLLYANGYKYVPGTNKHTSELSEVFKQRDSAKIQYLLDHDVSLEFQPKDGETALAYAIRNNLSQMVYDVLAYGADPNHMLLPDLSTLGWALIYRNTSAIILLLASGADCSAEILTEMQAKYRLEDIAAIKTHAVQLNKKLLNLSDILTIDGSNGKQIIAFLQHIKLRAQLGENLNAINVMLDGKELAAPIAITNIIAIYKDQKNKNLDFTDKVEIYKLLKFFKPKAIEFKGSRELIALIPEIVKSITSKPITAHSKEDLLEIATIMDELTALSASKFRPLLVKITLAHKAASAKKTIERYLAKNGITNLAKHLADLNHEPIHKPNRLLFAANRGNVIPDLEFSRDVLPLLTLTR